MKNKIILTISLVLLTIITTGCNNTSYAYQNDVEKVLQTNNYTIVDVRTNEEYNEGHVKDAVNIPYDEIDKDTDLDKTKTILVYCQSGKRSSIAYNNLKLLGYKVIDLGAYDTIDLEKEQK